MNSKLQIFCGREPFWHETRFWIRQLSPQNSHVNYVAYALPVTMRAVPPEEEGVEQPPAFSMNDEGCQRLMDELWRVGFRPSEGSGSAGSLAATERHLADMRHLVFKTKPQ
jgi:hypothetical protein